MISNDEQESYPPSNENPKQIVKSKSRVSAKTGSHHQFALISEGNVRHLDIIFPPAFSVPSILHESRLTLKIHRPYNCLILLSPLVFTVNTEFDFTNSQFSSFLYSNDFSLLLHSLTDPSLHVNPLQCICKFSFLPYAFTFLVPNF